MTSTAAGLKEFADGDAALFNGSVLLDFNSQEDFESEFHRLLCGDKPTDVYTKSESPVTNAIVDELKFLLNDSSYYPTDFFASPPDTLKPASESVKFVEDPLSTHLNSSTLNPQPQIKTIKPTLTDPRSKRGRPKHLRFTAVQYDKTTENTKLNRNFTDMTAQSSALKFRHRQSDSDCYSPAWIRGRGVEREGLCPLCDPPVWFKIKQSAYWYHLNFYHGISAATGKQYTHPISYRFACTESGTSRVEGHCGQCFQWIFLSAEFEGEQSTESVEESLSFTTWYKHAQKCHHRARNFQIPDELCE